MRDGSRSDQPPGQDGPSEPERKPAGWPDPPPRVKRPVVKPDPAQETLPLEPEPESEPELKPERESEPEPAPEPGPDEKTRPAAPSGADPGKPVPPPARDPAARAARPAARPVRPAPGPPRTTRPPRVAQPPPPAERPPTRPLHGLDLAEWWRRLSPEQRAAGIGAVLLIVSTFGPFSFVEAAIILLAGAILLLLRKRAENAVFHLPFGDGTVIAAAGLWSALLIVVRMFDRPLGQGLLALVCAAIIVLAGIRERSKRPPDDVPTARMRERSRHLEG